jgi:collagen beta-1,O-galactosyltransferase
MYPGSFRDDKQGSLPSPFPETSFRPSCGCAPLVYRAEYKEYYESRDLKAFSAEPLLIYPTHYTGQPGYLSDTETSTIWDNETVATDWDRTHSWKSRKQGHIRSTAKNTEALPPPTSLDTVPSRDEL